MFKTRLNKNTHSDTSETENDAQELAVRVARRTHAHREGVERVRTYKHPWVIRPSHSTAQTRAMKTPFKNLKDFLLWQDFIKTDGNNQ